MGRSRAARTGASPSMGRRGDFAASGTAAGCSGRIRCARPKTIELRVEGKSSAEHAIHRPRTKQPEERPMTTITRFAVPVCAALGLALSASSALAQKTFTLRFNHVLAPSEPYHQGFLSWAKRAEERTNGGLKIQVFHSAQLGVEEDIIEQMRQGAAIGQNTDSARLGNYVKGLAVVNGPYFAETLDEVDKLGRAPTIVKWQDELATQHGLKVVCFAAF